MEFYADKQANNAAKKAEETRRQATQQKAAADKAEIAKKVDKIKEQLSTEMENLQEYKDLKATNKIDGTLYHIKTAHDSNDLP